MSRVSDFLVRDLNEQSALVIDAVVDINDVPDLLVKNLKKIEEYLNNIGEFLSDTPFVAFHNDDLKHLQVEVGFPLRKPVKGKEDIRFEAVPAGKVVMCMHVGPRSAIRPIYDEINVWMKENNLSPVGHIMEYYYGSKDQLDEENLVTKIIVPLK